MNITSEPLIEEHDALTMSQAIYSPCQRYRYWLDRRGLLPVDRPVVFCMLNPSTATAFKNDPTVARTDAFARAWGYGRRIVVNAFAFRATAPRDMRAQRDPIGPLNDAHIRRAASIVQSEGGLFVVAWGNHGSMSDRDHQVVALLHAAGVTPMCLDVTSKGQPGHPLYLRGSIKPFEYRPRERIAKAVERFQQEHKQ